MMTHREALEVLAANRGDRVVVTTMGSVAIWPDLSDTPLDFAYLPSSMGQSVPLALGMAMAQPRRGVIVVSGDGGLLMNLGCLVTVADYDVPVYVIVIDNGLYEVTGGQWVAGAGRTDFAGMARAAGVAQVASFEAVEAWREAAPGLLSGRGPVFVALRVQGVPGQKTPTAPRPMAEQIARLRRALNEVPGERGA